MHKKSLSQPEKRIGNIRSETFENGLKVYFRENDDASIVSLQVWVKTGSVHEGKYLGCGLSHFLEHMLFKGTAAYPGTSIAETVHQLGGDINAYTSYGATVYHIDIASVHALKAIDILAEMVSCPAFPADKFEDEKNVILRERDMYLDNPGRVLLEKLNLEMFAVHPIKHPIIGYKEKIETVDKTVMEDYYNTRYSPVRTFFVISGKIDSDLAFDCINKKLGNWKIGNLDEVILPEEPSQICQKNAVFRFKDPLARLALAYHIPDVSHPDIPALDVLVSILGQSKSSRLVSRLKTQKQLALSVSAYNFTPYFCGMLKTGITCKPEHIQQVKDELFSEIEKLRTLAPSAAEIEREQLMLVTDYLRNLNSNDNVARIMGNAILSCGSPEYADKYIQDMSRVTPEDVLAAAGKYLDIGNSTLVELIPENVIIPKARSSAAEKAAPVMEQLPQGQKIIVNRNPALPLIDICIALPGGVIAEDKDSAGLSNLVALALNTSTAVHSEQDFAELLDENAIDLTVSSGNNALLVRMNFHKNKLNTALSALVEMLNSCSFNEAEFSREKLNTIEGIKSRQLNPQNAAEDKMCELLFGDHPYSHPSVGLTDALDKITAEQARKFFRTRCLIPGKAVIGISGDVSVKGGLNELKMLAKSLDWNLSGDFNLPEAPTFPDKSRKEKVSVPREQTVVMCGFPGCSITNSDKYGIDILQTSLNNQASSLFKAIREEAGLAYYTGFYSSKGLHEGFLSFYAGTQPQSAEKVIELLNAERLKLAENGLDKEEFASAKNAIYFTIAEQMQDAGSVIYSSVLSEYYGNGFETPWKMEEIYRNYKLEDFNAVVKKYLSSISDVTVISGP